MGTTAIIRGLCDWGKFVVERRLEKSPLLRRPAIYFSRESEASLKHVITPMP